MTSNRPAQIIKCLAPWRLFGGAVAIVISVALSDKATAADEDIREIVRSWTKTATGWSVGRSSCARRQ